MSGPFIISIFTTILFGGLAIYFSFLEEKLKKNLLRNKQIYKQEKYQATVIQAINDKISYSLDIEKVVDVITGSIKNFFSYSTVSSLVLKNNTLRFKMHCEESVNQAFIEHIKIDMLSSLRALTSENVPTHMEEFFSGTLIDNAKQFSPASFFHVPLTVDNKPVAIITIASNKPDMYAQQDTAALYQIAHQASQSLTRLHEITRIEKRKLMSLIGSLADGVFMVDMHSELTVINDAAKNFLNIQKENPTIIDILSSIPQTDMKAKIEKAIAENILIKEKELQIGEKFVQIFITPVFLGETLQASQNGNKGPVIGASVLLHDITLEKNLSHMKEDFTHMMVHELRAPVSAMKGASELLLTNKNLTEAEQEQMLTIIHTQAAKLLDQVGFILDAAKVEAGKFILNKTTDDIKKVITDQIQVFTSQAENKHINMVNDVDTAIPLIEFDVIRIGQVLNNLLSNSIKFTPEGGTIYITALYKSEQKQVQVRVADTGIGIPSDKQDKLFSKFFQIHENGQSRSGSGLGLYITKGIIDAHDGTIQLQSEAGQGTTITFSIPVGNPHVDQQEKIKQEHFFDKDDIRFEFPIRSSSSPAHSLPN